MSQDKFIEAYTRLRGLKGNLPGRPKSGDILPVKFVDEFHLILDGLSEVSGLDLTNFRVPNTDIRRPRASVSAHYDVRRKEEKEELVCERAFLSMKIDAVLEFFEIRSALSQKSQKIGFNPPKG